jgi:uncharacterized protein (DUF2252 family)
MKDVVESIRAYNAGRDPDRLAMKLARMRASPFVFLRGTCHRFYETLPQAEVLASAPSAWVCGDLHLENFGSYKGDNRQVYFDINDFDEATLAPLTWDLVRLLASLRVAAAELRVVEADIQSLCRAFLDSYTHTLAVGQVRWIERETADGLIGALLNGLRRRTRVAWLDRRTTLARQRRTLLVDGRRALAASAAQHERVTAILGKFASGRPDAAFYRVLDVARRIAGTGSLGVERYVVLVEGRGSPDGNFLLDLKEALPSALDPLLGRRRPQWSSEAQRVVELQARLQAVPMALLHPVVRRKRSYVLRSLQPSEDRVNFDPARTTLPQLSGLLIDLGRLAAWAHLRGSGRQGAANADELGAYARLRPGKWHQQLQDAAERAARRVRKDWRAFSAAHEAGAFGKDPKASVARS